MLDIRRKLEETVDTSYTQDRELSWLRFNERVLDEATDETVPLFERMKFVEIFTSNLDEFFMVRVANILRQYRNGASNTSPDRMTPARQLAEIRRRVLLHTARAQSHWNKTLRAQLAERSVRIVDYDELSEKQRRFLER